VKATCIKTPTRERGRRPFLMIFFWSFWQIFSTSFLWNSNSPKLRLISFPAAPHVLNEIPCKQTMLLETHQHHNVYLYVAHNGAPDTTAHSCGRWFLWQNLHNLHFLHPTEFNKRNSELKRVERVGGKRPHAFNTYVKFIRYYLTKRVIATIVVWNMYNQWKHHFGNNSVHAILCQEVIYELVGISSP
jgi:hypothetical protein